MNTGRAERHARRVAGTAGRRPRNAIASLLLLLLLALSPTQATAQPRPADGAIWSARDFQSATLGRIQIHMPATWAAYERQDGAGTTFVRVVPPNDRFGLEIQINTRAALKRAALNETALPDHLVASLSDLLPRFLEDAVVPQRFGPGEDGVYARLTDRHPRAGEFLFLTRGLRLHGEALIVFTLYASDHDASVLTDVLGVVAGITITAAD